MKKILYKDESFKITGACFDIYSEMGNGFLEPVYQECLELELSATGIHFKEKKKLMRHYISHRKKHTLKAWTRAGLRPASAQTLTPSTTSTTRSKYRNLTLQLVQ